MISLYPHQQKVIDDLRQSLMRFRSVALRAPCGFGKTCVAAFMLGSAAQKGKRSIFTVHRQELIDQSAELFESIGLHFGIIAAGYKEAPEHLIQIASIETLKRRLESVPIPALLVPDECHHMGSKGWTDVANYYAAAKIVGLSATLRRLDGKPLDHVFQHIVHGPEVAWLIENKYLSPYRAFSPSTPDTTQLPTRMGDFVQSDNEELMSKPEIVGSAIESYQKFCPDKRAVLFAVSIKHSQRIAEAFRAAGILAIHIDGNTPKQERKNAIKDFRDGRIKVLTNCDIISEGFDLPAMDAAILMRPTQSLTLHIQQTSRCLRYQDGKTAFILDHAGNIARHAQMSGGGLPDDVFEWSLKGRIKKKTKTDESIISIRTCEKCYFTHRPSPSCPNCGFVYPIQAREIEEREGQLSEINIKARRKKELKSAKTKDQLIALALSRHNPAPETWAQNVLDGRARYKKMIIDQWLQRKIGARYGGG